MMVKRTRTRRIPIATIPATVKRSTATKSYTAMNPIPIVRGKATSNRGAPKAPDSAPNSPTANEKPVQRIQFTSKDFYHGHSNNDCFNAWKLYKKDKTGESEHDRQKKLKRIERVETVTTRRKVKERQVNTIRQKKDKPPKTVRVRNTRPSGSKEARQEGQISVLTRLSAAIVAMTKGVNASHRGFLEREVHSSTNLWGRALKTQKGNKVFRL